MGRVTRLWPEHRGLLRMIVLFWCLVATGCGGGVNGGISGNARAAVRVPGNQEDCWACVEEWCKQNPKPCNSIIRVQCNDTIEDILCPQGMSSPNSTRDTVESYIKQNNGGKLPADVRQSISRLCVQSAELGSKKGGTCV